MALSNTHTNWSNGSYQDDLYAHLKSSENDVLYQSRNSVAPTNLNAHNDGKSVAFGYGYDVIQNSNTLQVELAPYITAVQPNTTVETALQNVRSLVDNFNHEINQLKLPNNNARRDTLVTAINSHITLSTEANATLLLNDKIQQFEVGLTNKLGATHNLPQSTERVGVIGQMYRLGINGIPSTINAIANDNRAEAWYEIRYNSNADKLFGNVSRVITESDMFGLYNNASTNLTLDEAQNIARMYTLHQNQIEAEEQAFSNTYSSANSINSQLQPIKTFLATEISNQYGLTDVSINGDVLVGRGLESYQNIRAEQRDTTTTLTGTTNNDLVFAKNSTTINLGEGDNIVVSGSANQTFNAGGGNDIYIIEKQNTSYSYIINDLNGDDKVILKGFKEEDIKSFSQNQDNNNLDISLKNGSVITLNDWNLNNNRVEEIVFDDKTYNVDDIRNYIANNNEIIRNIEGESIYHGSNKDNTYIIDKNTFKEEFISIYDKGGNDTIEFRGFNSNDISGYKEMAPDNQNALINLGDKEIIIFGYHDKNNSIENYKFDDKTFTKDEFQQLLTTISNSEQESEPSLTDLIVADLALSGINITNNELTELANSKELQKELESVQNKQNDLQNTNTNDNNNVMMHRLS